MFQQGGESTQYQHRAYEWRRRVKEKCKNDRDDNHDKNGNGEAKIPHQSFHHEASFIRMRREIRRKFAFTRAFHARANTAQTTIQTWRRWERQGRLLPTPSVK